MVVPKVYDNINETDLYLYLNCNNIDELDKNKMRFNWTIIGFSK
jgi:hypothetical protein